MTSSIRQNDLDAFLDEALPSEEMARIEQALRNDGHLKERLAETIARRDNGDISIGSLWRSHRLSCPARDELCGLLLGVLPDDAADYIKFHIEVVGCRTCRANLDDLASRQAEAVNGNVEDADSRRRKYFQSSVGHLRKIS
jgi:hypothetical protein